MFTAIFENLNAFHHKVSNKRERRIQFLGGVNAEKEAAKT